MRTALLRRAARLAENRFQWERAARFWDAAVRRYPESPGSQLALRDILQMEAQAEACRVFNGRIAT